MPKQATLQINIGEFEKALDANLNRVESDPEYMNSLMSPPCKGNPVVLGPRVKSADDWANDQVSNAVNAADRYAKNVLAPARNPVEAALAASAKRKQKVAEAESQGKWDKAMAKVDQDQMYATIKKRGAAAFSSGVSDRKEKIVARVKELQPMVAALADTLDKMPQGTDAEREAKMIAAKRGMQTIGKKRRGIS
jgi:hypothetical protein